MLYEAQSGNLTLVASGDTMITRKLSVFREDGFVRLQKLFRDADVGFTNLEMLMHDYEHSPGMAGGTFTASDPKNLQELEWMGVNLVSCANNHSYDYGEGGVLTNLKHLHHSDLVHAGTGRNLSEARAPAYLGYPERPRCPHIRFLDIRRSRTRARTASRHQRTTRSEPSPPSTPRTFVDRPAFDALRRVNTKLGLEAQRNALRNFRHPGAVSDDGDTRFVFLDEVFALGRGVQCQHTARQARSDGQHQVGAGCAAHGGLGDGLRTLPRERRAPPTSRPSSWWTSRHACIDEGADVFIGHGPHVTRGIEIYKDRPIMYSLGNFIFQNDTVRWQPSYNYETVKLDADATPADFYDARSDHDKPRLPRRRPLLGERSRPLRV